MGWARLRQVGLELHAHRGRQRGVVDAEHDLEIDAQAARIEIRRAAEHNVVHDNQLRVQHLRLVLPDLDPFVQPTPVQRPRGKLPQAPVALAGQQQTQARRNRLAHASRTGRPVKPAIMLDRHRASGKLSDTESKVVSQ